MTACSRSEHRRGRTVLVVGDIVSERIRRDIVHLTLTQVGPLPAFPQQLTAETDFQGRMGMPGGLQLDVRAPYGYEKERTVSADEIERSRSASGLSDLLTSVHWKAPTGRDPFRLNSPEPALGTGFHSIQAAVTAAKTSDPVVFFGGLSYTSNLAATKQFRGLDPVEPDEPTAGRFNPGNTFGMQMGMAIGLNPDTSLSLGWSQRFSSRTTFDGKALPGTFLTEANLRIGTSYVYSTSRAVDVGLGIGLTRDTPDFQFSLTFPFRFALLRQRTTPAGD